MEHPGPVVPVGEHALRRPALADHVVQPGPSSARAPPAPAGVTWVWPDVRGRIEHVSVGGRDVDVAADDSLRGGAADAFPSAASHSSL